MACQGSPSVKALLSQATAIAPTRNKASDGICASQQHHAQNPTSDHEADSRGLAHAGDVTNSEVFPVHALLRQKVVKRRDVRVKYIISNWRIISYYPVGGYPAWAERPYHGSNPHTQHGHVSIRYGVLYENDTSPWWTDDEEDELAGEIGKQILAEVQAQSVRLKAVEESVGERYPGGPTLQKALVRYEDTDDDPETPKLPQEHLNTLQDMLSEVIHTLGELADAIRKLSEGNDG